MSCQKIIRHGLWNSKRPSLRHSVLTRTCILEQTWQETDFFELTTAAENQLLNFTVFSSQTHKASVLLYEVCWTKTVKNDTAHKWSITMVCFVEKDDTALEKHPLDLVGAAFHDRAAMQLTPLKGQRWMVVSKGVREAVDEGTCCYMSPSWQTLLWCFPCFQLVHLYSPASDRSSMNTLWAVRG